MKQMVTIFRAEGSQALRLRRLCQRTRKTDLFGLRETFRNQARSSCGLSAYMEFIDEWSMGDDFIAILGPEARERYTREGVVYVVTLTAQKLAVVNRKAGRRQQFPEQVHLAQTITGLVKGCGAGEPPIALVIFREILPASITAEAIKEGSKKRGQTTA